MNQFENIYAAPSTVAMQDVETRATFIRKTYMHLAGAIAVFAILETIFLTLVKSSSMEAFIVAKMFSPLGWGLTLAIFIGSSMVAEKMARSATSMTTQYMGLGLGVLGWAIVFVPMLVIATNVASDQYLVAKAAVITLSLFAGLTFVALTTKKDFSFLGGILKIGGFVALGLIVASLIFGFALGTWFSVVMVLFAGGSILYNTSNMIHEYRTDQYVSAALGLFASVALLFWYIIRILISMASSD